MLTDVGISSRNLCLDRRCRSTYGISFIMTMKSRLPLGGFRYWTCLMRRRRTLRQPLPRQMGSFFHLWPKGAKARMERSGIRPQLDISHGRSNTAVHQ